MTAQRVEFKASYSTIRPLINGDVNPQEWRDANSYEINFIQIQPSGFFRAPATIYFKHDGMKIYLGLKVFTDAHHIDGFGVLFDEGDDGLYGSGTRDGELTKNQEDYKICQSYMQSDRQIFDGYYDNNGWPIFMGGDYYAKCAFVEDHWECEFSIPFAGNDGDTKDKSDLVCDVTDTVGIKIQYYFYSEAVTLPADVIAFDEDTITYFYPLSDIFDCLSYTTLSFDPVPPPYIDFKGSIFAHDGTGLAFPFPYNGIHRFLYLDDGDSIATMFNFPHLTGNNNPSWLTAASENFVLDASKCTNFVADGHPFATATYTNGDLTIYEYNQRKLTAEDVTLVFTYDLDNNEIHGYGWGTITGLKMVNGVSGICEYFTRFSQRILITDIYSQYPVVYSDPFEYHLTFRVTTAVDSDDDGITNDVDMDPFLPSDDFSDVYLGGTTTGEITERGDQILTVMEEPNPDGVRIKADPSGGANVATVSVYGGAGQIDLSAGDEVVVTSGSVTVEVINGVVEVRFVATDGTPASTSLSAGNSLTFNPETCTFTAGEDNYDVVIVIVNGQEYSIDPNSAAVNFAVISYQDDCVFSVSSNSTISELEFNSANKELTFSISGAFGTTGYVKTYIPKSLATDASGLKVYLDGNQVDCTPESKSDSWLLYFSYQHSTHAVTITLGTSEGPFENWILYIVAAVVIIAVVAIVFVLKIKNVRVSKDQI